MTKKLIAAVAMVLGFGGAAFAQQQIAGDGYRAAPLEPSLDWWTILYFVVACMGCAVVAFKSARRTHLD